jgi:hypothetical protein
MATTTSPSLSEWNDLPHFLNEISQLQDYLNGIVSNNKYLSKSQSEILDDCDGNLQKIIKLCELQNDHDFPPFGTFLFEFNSLSKKIIDEFKLKTENYSNELSYKDLKKNIKSLSKSMKKNIFLANETKLITCSISSNSFDSTKFYIKIGDILKDSEKAVAIKKELATLRSGGDGVTSYYASIVGPSFMGKTQTAFILSHHMTVFYVNLLSTFKKGDVTLQPIYNETAEFSRLFLRTIKADMELLEREKIVSNAHDLLGSNISFETLGLLFVLIYDQKLNPNLSVEERFVRWCTISEVLIPKLTVRVFKKKLRGN